MPEKNIVDGVRLLSGEGHYSAVAVIGVMPGIANLQTKSSIILSSGEEQVRLLRVLRDADDLGNAEPAVAGCPSITVIVGPPYAAIVSGKHSSGMLHIECCGVEVDVHLSTHG